MSNNPIIFIDPNGDDDYYNEKGEYLFTDKKTSNDIRVMSQKHYEELNNNFSNEIAKGQFSNIGLMATLEVQSRKVNIKIDGNELLELWNDSHSEIDIDKTDDLGNIRCEKVKLIVLDFENAEIKLVTPDNLNSDTHESINYDTYGPTEKERYSDKSYKLRVIGNIHTHPNKEKETNNKTYFQSPFENSQDQETASFRNMPTYYINRNEVDYVAPKIEDCVDNYQTRENTFSGKFNIGKDALEKTGGKPKQ
jgi:hypothetical protein